MHVHAGPCSIYSTGCFDLASVYADLHMLADLLQHILNEHT